LAHGADVNWANSDENQATPLIQAVLGVWINAFRLY
jgi:Arf-GAP/coiled-coil/ANK repeat/PH domain-containing protein